MSESVKVMVRCRPLIPRQQSLRMANIVKINNELHQISISKPKSVSQQARVFTFDNVFGPQCKQDEIYEQTAFLLVQNVLQGYNGTIFAYGQTGCGKTFTMSGGNSEQLKGIIPRAFRQITTITAGQREKKHLIQCSFIEIYNEEIYDLFEKKTKTKLQLIETPGKGTFIKDQRLQIVRNFDELTKLFQLGSKNRAVRGTTFNKNSSRSHCVFTIYVESAEIDEEGTELFKAGKLNLVDLAGSERQSKLKQAGEGLKETTRINLSLSALGNVISALADGKAQHIPYRDSKLTRLLQDSLGGNTKTIMIANISPSQSCYEETLSTLRYASRAKFIKNKPIINEDPKDALLRQYAQEIKRLKNILQGISPSLLDRKQPLDPVQLQEYKKKEEKDNEEKQALKKKLDSLQKLLAKQELQEDPNEYEKIKKLRQKLKEQRQKQEQYLKDKKQRQQELLYLETNYKSLNQEVDLLRQRFHELKTKYLQAQQELKDQRQSSEEEKQQLLDQVRQQNFEISKYRGIIENILSQEQVEHIVGKSKIDEEEQQWKIAKFTLKQNIVIFPQSVLQPLGDLKKQKVNMFVSESQPKNIGIRKQKSEASISKYQTNLTQKSRKSFNYSESSKIKKNKSINGLYEIKSGKQLNPLKKIPEKKANVEEKKKLNIDLGKLKMDILSQLNKNRNKGTTDKNT